MCIEPAPAPPSTNITTPLLLTLPFSFFLSSFYSLAATDINTQAILPYRSVSGGLGLKLIE
jgi:hypothetical protein